MNSPRFFHLSWVAIASLSALLIAPTAVAQPDRHGHQGREHQPRHERAHPQPRHERRDYAPPRHAPRQHQSRHEPRHEPRHLAPSHRAAPSYSRPVVHHRAPPRDFRALRQDIRPHSHYIKRGPARPSHYRVVRGHKLPHGYGRVLAYEHHHYLPRYAGYEWRSSGRDLILVAATTGIVYAIMDNILQ